MAHVTVPDEYADDPGRVLGHYAPEMATAAGMFAMSVYQSTKLPHRIVEGARIRTAQINGCEKCQTWRSQRDAPDMFQQFGGDASQSFVVRGDPPDDEFYEAIENWRTSNVFNDRERLAIEFAERMGTAPKSFEGDDAFWTAMHAAFDDFEIVDLTLAVAGWMAMGRSLHVLAIDPQVCAIPTMRATA